MVKVIHLTNFIFIIMSKAKKQKEIEPSLQPWYHEQENNNTIHHPQLIQSSFNPEAHLQEIQYFPGERVSPALNRFNQSISRNAFSKQQSRNGSPGKKYCGVDFVKKNQQSLKSYHCMSQNYNSLLNDDLEAFMPLNPSLALNQYLRRPTINTTYIGYYDQQPFLIESTVKPRTKKQVKKSKSIQTRPRTSDTTTILHENQFRRSEEKQMMAQSFYDRATLSVGGCHLQKMLKIKEKLRQKLKRNSEKKDIQRGLYVKSAMKIQDQRGSSVGDNNSFAHARTPSQSRKSSKVLENGQKEKVRVDKWKQYIRLKNQNNKANMNNQNQKNNKFFAVLGGAIYK